MSQERRLVVWLLVFAALGTFVYVLRGALLPFVVGMAVAYLLDPVADRLERLGMPRALASLLIVFVFIIAVAAILVVLVPILVDQVTDLVARVPSYVDSLRREATPILRRIRSSLTPGQAAQIDEAIRSHAGDVIGWIGTIVSSIVSGGAALLGLLGLVFIMPFVAFYMIRDWDRLIAYIDSLLPRKG